MGDIWKLLQGTHGALQGTEKLILLSCPLLPDFLFKRMKERVFENLPEEQELLPLTYDIPY